MAPILKSAQKGGGGPTYKALTSWLLINGSPEQNDATHGGSWGRGGGVHGNPSGPMDEQVYKRQVLCRNATWQL